MRPSHSMPPGQSKDRVPSPLTSPHKLSSTLHASHSENIGAKQHEVDSYARLMLHNQCYEAMPTSSKMVVFDSQLFVRKAFHGLIYQNTRHVLISESSRGGTIEGILSVTDFIRVMLRLHKEQKEAGQDTKRTTDGLANDQTDIGSMTIKNYRELIESEGKLMSLVSIDATSSLLEAARVLAENHIHRLPVMDPETGSPLFILTHKRILQFLWCFGRKFCLPIWDIKTARDLGVGTWTGIRVVFPDSPLTDCLDILLHKGVSGLPVVDRKTLQVIDMYSRFDAIGIALEDTTDLNVSVDKALHFKNLNKDDSCRVVSVRDTDTLWKAVTVLVERNVHRLCAVNENGGIEGIISLSDIINFMVVKPGKDLSPPLSTRKHYNHSRGGDIQDQDLRNLLLGSAVQLERTATGQMTKEDTYSRR